ncbi:MAG: hypothetical protein ACRCV0_00235, partial [Brevinema sp.]
MLLNHILSDKKSYLRKLESLQKDLEHIYKTIKNDQSILIGGIFMDFKDECPKIKKDFINQYLEDSKYLLDHIKSLRTYCQSATPFPFMLKNFTEFHTRKKSDPSAIRNLIIRYTYLIASLCFKQESVLDIKSILFNLLQHICPNDIEGNSLMRSMMPNDFYKYLNKLRNDKNLYNDQIFKRYNQTMPFEPEDEDILNQWMDAKGKKMNESAPFDIENNVLTPKTQEEIEENLKCISYMKKFIFDNRFYNNFEDYREKYIPIF